MPSSGYFYTWTNRKSGEDLIVVKLDRAMVNTEWLQVFPFAKAHFHKPITSDHSCIEVTLDNHMPSRPKPFKFFNSWTKHQDYHSVTDEVWRTKVIGSPMFIVSKKLKLVKEALKVFNAFVFQPSL